MSGFFGIVMSSLQPQISSKSLTAKANKSTSSVDVLSTANNRGTLTYNWKRSGKISTINTSTSAATTVTGLDTDTGSTVIYCDITDSVTGVTVSSPEAVITWTDVVYQNIVISRAVTYTGSAQAYTLTGTPATPAPSGTPSTFISAGTYVYPTNITITTDSEYTLGTVSGSFTIGKAILTITTNNASMIYGSSLPTFTHTSTGFVNSETSTVITGTVTHSTTGSSTSNVGTYSITPSVSGLSATNYTFTPVNGTLTINRATLTITSSNTSMTYGSSLPTFTHTSSGFLGSDNASVITGTVTHSTTGSSTSNVGTYSITPSVSGLTATNYTFTPVNGTLTINRATLTITSSNTSMTYGSSLPTFTHTSSGFLGSDNASVITGTVTHTTTGSSTANAGSYTITPSVSGLSATNYTFTPVNGTLTINQAQLTATTTTGSATYNGSSQTVTVLGGINGTFSGSTSVSGINAGGYTTTITGTGNYGGTVTGTLTINRATLTATTTTGSATYNGGSQAVTVLSGINGTFTGSTSVSGTNAGSYSTTITGTGNHTGSVTGTLTINAATLAASTTTGSATYDGGSKTATVISGINGTYSGSTSVSGINAGTYSTTITGTGNYAGSVGGTLTINPATLTAANRVGSATYTGFSQAATVISGINGTYSGSTSVSGINAGSYTTTITGTGNYTGSVTGTLTINQAQLTASTTTSPHTFYNRQQQSFTISGINGTYSGTPTVYGTNAGSYSTTIYGTGNYSGSVTGTLTIYQDVGYVDIFYGGVYDSSHTRDIFVPVRTSNAAFTVTHSVSGRGAADAQHTSFGLSGPYDWNGLYDPVPPGAVVRNTNPYTQGFVVTITAAINDSNYGYMSATTSVTVNAYVAPPPTGGGITE